MSQHERLDVLVDLAIVHYAEDSLLLTHGIISPDQLKRSQDRLIQACHRRRDFNLDLTAEQYIW